MKKRTIVILNLIKIIILYILFFIAVHFESASGNRSNILSIIFISYLALGIVRGFFLRNQLPLTYSFLLDIFLIYLLEHNSRFMINYFFHSFYIVILLEICLTLKREKSLFIGIITVGVSLIKYIVLISYKNNLANISEMAFFILLNALILIITNFAQYNKEEKEKKDLLYKELLNTHKKLKEYANRVEELAVIEERNRIARDIHDTLGHNMTALIMQIEMSGHIMEEDIDRSKGLLESAKKMARKGLLDIRKVVETLRGEKGNTKVNSVQELVNGFSNATGIKTELKIKGEPVKVNPDIEVTLYRVIQEALTNSVRHGKATKVKVELKYNDKYIFFNIIDNGMGAESIKEGYGLKGMKERVDYLNGKIEFETKDGFVVKGYLPLEDALNRGCEHDKCTSCR